ncbi:MAG: hypothetical protein Q7T55_04770 [Solirubrobacteraceae bacterium]|nr:hypothetical protein [Solirubrobacteraceae bacterium]
MLARRDTRIARVDAAVEELLLPPAIWKTCPWEPRDLIETGLRQWLRCAGAAMVDQQVIGMPSRAVDEIWHGFILCTARYERFCEQAYGRFLHHHPEGDHVEGERAKPKRRGAIDPGNMQQQLARTIAAWTLVAQPGETCVLWDLDRRVGVEGPWGIEPGFVSEITQVVAARR